MRIEMDAGIGTHMDAPSHCIPRGLCIDQFGINELIGPCIVIDISDKSDSEYCLSPDDIIDFENRYGSIKKKSWVLIRTGWSRFWNDPERYRNNHQFPSVSIEAALLLLDRDIYALGIDTLSADVPKNGFEVHKTFLGAGKLLIENIANLEALPPVGAFIMSLPLKIKDGTEAPTRLIGLIKND
jgi:kynurenine formamidase